MDASGGTAVAGWYPDANDSTVERWWDGEKWTETVRPLGGAVPAAAVAPAAPAAPAATTASKGRRPLLLALAALVAVAIVGFVVLSGGGDDKTIKAEGKEIVNAEELIGDADAAFGAIVTKERASTTDRSKCFFSYPRDGDRPNPFLRCGPVLFADSKQASPWMTLSYLLLPDQEGDLRGELAGEFDERSASLAEGETLRRPDGESADVDAELSLPDPPPQEKGALTLTDDPPPIDLTPLAGDPRLVAKSVGVKVVGVETADRLGTGKDALIAADGEHFVVARFELQDVGDSDYDDASPAAAVSVDGVKTSLPSEWSDGDAKTLVVSVPKDAKDVSLALSESGLDQRLSLLTGARNPDAPKVLYRDRTTVGVQQSFTLNYTYDFGGNPYPDEVSLTVSEARLSWFVSGANPPSNPDKAWLTLAIEAGYYGGAPLPVERALLTLPDGSTVQPVRIGSPSGLIGDLVWEVPADLATATITIAPGSTQEGDTIYDFGVSSAVVQVAFK